MKEQKLVLEVGINDFDKVKVDGKMIKIYSIWYGMINRCYNLKYLSRCPTYKGCSVCKEWLTLSKFKSWFDLNYKEGFELDKDILIPGNKEYGPDACRFVPHYLNSLLTDSGASRGSLPLGVTLQKSGSYLSQCHNGFNKRLTKTFKTLSEAIDWYSVTKKQVVKEQAQRAFLDNSIKTDVYLALIRRNF